MFDALSSKLQEVLKRLRGKGKLTESDVNESLREVRLALLEADVNFKVVKDFVQRIKERAVGQDVLGSLTPGQQVIKIVHDELTSLMGGSAARLNVSPKPPTVVLLVGLQGSGKTTTAAKLALHLKKQGRRPLLVAADVYRPAAVKQLQVVGQQVGVTVHAEDPGTPPLEIASSGTRRAQAEGYDTVIVDTAGRLHIDEELMKELEEIAQALSPAEILLVADAMTGQEAVNVASAFNERLRLTGVILTKLDSDARGGAALSIKAATGAPIKFVGVGEKMDALEPFHPDRMASRILGMGDVLTLIERAEQALDAAKARELEKKMRSDEFGFEEFLEQLKQVRRLGPLDQVLGMIPGFGKMRRGISADVEEKELTRIEAIINSMTREERRNPSIINGSRRRRIALGSGTSVQDVNRLLKQFEQVRALMKQVQSLEKGGRRGLGFPWA